MVLYLSAFLNYLARVRHTRAFAFLLILFLLVTGISYLVHIHAVAMNSFDRRVTLFIQRFRNVTVDRLMRLLTLLGDPQAVIALGALSWLGFALAGRPGIGFFCALSVLGLPLNFLIKELIRRPRPDQAIVKVLLPVVGRSFPSGHAMSSILFYGFLAAVAWVLIDRPELRTAVTLLLMLLPVGIGVSRIYLGVHWFSDVVGGWAAGLFFLVLLQLLFGVMAGNELRPIS